ncbi:MAG: sulfurtransferase [Lewinellaceae bacterium]|nr:sulfurtransferase [Lewinellaceae bacterium]
MTPLISPAGLLSLRHQANFILIDARYGPNAKQAYAGQHLDGALFVDLDTDLSQKGNSAAEGGRHPLPPLDKFLHVLGRLGISPESHVVVYDEKNGALAAARFWWMLRAVGHQTVQVLDGGMQAAIEAGFPTNADKVELPEPTVYEVSHWSLPMATAEEVEQAAKAPNHVVIDVREADRFRGEREPLDKIAGHIPGAVNVPFFGNLDPSGKFLPADELKRKYSDILGETLPTGAIVHCGSGVTACHTLLAMEQAGLDLPKLYVGSWSEWSESGRQVATGA